MFEQKIGGVKMKNKKGFTLVELLVVIAIIGILSSVAVVNLNSARSKAKIAAVKGSLSGLAAAGELFADDNSDYDAFCLDAALNNATSSAGVAGGLTAANFTCNEAVDNSTWALSVDLDAIESGAGDYCISNTGSKSSGPAVAGLCP